MRIVDICSIVSIIISILTFVAGAVAFVTIRFNDFFHAEKNLAEFKDIVISNLKSIEAKLDNLEVVHNENKQKLAVIDERCEIHHNKVRSRKKRV